MPYNSAAEIEAEIGKQTQAIEALRANDGNRDAAIRQLESSMEKIAQGMAAQKLQGRSETPDSDLDDHMVSRADAEELLVGQAHLREGFHYVTPPKGSTGGGDVLILRTCETEDGPLPGLLDSQTETPWVSRLKDITNARNTLLFVAQQAPNMPKGYGALIRQANRALKRHLQKAPSAEIRDALGMDRVERLFSGAATAGAEMIFDLDMPRLADRVDLNSPISGLFEQVPVNSGRRVVVPTISGGITPFLQSAATTDDPPKRRKSSAVIGSKTYDIVTFAIATQYDEDASDDVTWISVANVLADKLGKAMAWGREDVVINGDTTATHQDTLSTWNTRGLWTTALLGGADDHRRGWLGLRKIANARSASASGSGDANIAASFRAARSGLTGPRGLGQVVHLVSYAKFLSGVVGLQDFKTPAEYMNNATVINGGISGPLPNQVGVIDGVPICIAWFLTDDLETTGLYTGGGGGKTGTLTLDRASFQFMSRRGARIETAKDITRGVFDQVLTMRELFAIDASVGAADKPVYFRYNL